MADIEERLTLLEQEHVKLKNENTALSKDNAELKKAIELHTIAISGLVNKTTLERLNQKYDRLFETLITHDDFTNKQLAELRDQNTQLDGKIVGLQTEVRQRFEAQDGKIVGLQTEMRQRFEAQDKKLDQLLQLFTQRPE